MIEGIIQPQRNHCSVSFIFGDRIAQFLKKKKKGKKLRETGLGNLLTWPWCTLMPNQYNVVVGKWVPMHKHLLLRDTMNIFWILMNSLLFEKYTWMTGSTNAKGNLSQANRMPEFYNNFLNSSYKCVPILACKQTEDHPLYSQAFFMLSFIKNKTSDVQSIISWWPCKSWQKTLKKTCKMYCKAWSTGFLPKLGKGRGVKTCLL